VQLAHALGALGNAHVEGDATVDVVDVEADSRLVGPGHLFVAIRGEHHDGHEHVAAAIDAGAVAVLVEHPVATSVPQAIVEDARRAVGPVAAEVHGRPSEALEVVGVTGTNGKTTTTHLLANVLTEAGRRVEVLGTLSGVRTTPEAPELQRRLAAWRDGGVDAVAMEVSSHALDLHRVDGTRFRVGVFTNLSRDHLDFHRTMEAYFQAKARLFTPELCDRAVVNLDSPYGRLLSDAATLPTSGYALDDVEDLALSVGGSTFTWRGQEVRVALGGLFNVANALAAAGAAEALGIPDDVIAAGLSRPVTVPGRFEVVEVGQDFAVVVDYAHTPDALEQLLEAAGPLVGTRPDGTPGLVTVVFGCGGDRDADKRPLMGQVAASLADRVVVTADNSRGEPTEAIIEAVMQGAARAEPRRAEVSVEPDRRAAIALALGAAVAGDVVLVAGKGHETTQTVGADVTPFDDRAVVRDLLRRVGGAA
jgi:UDP-N-acetylmuramoyl-L-alanyl-D-glutamate--2,6-diaminopimelate ligase